MSLSTAEVSVIVPCRDAASTLGEALESALAQTVKPLEVLVIDDGSRDRSARVARKFGAPVRVLMASQRGPGAARRLGVHALSSARAAACERTSIQRVMYAD